VSSALSLWPRLRRRSAKASSKNFSALAARRLSRSQQRLLNAGPASHNSSPVGLTSDPAIAHAWHRPARADDPANFLPL
jgi:hypothetical protein